MADPQLTLVASVFRPASLVTLVDPLAEVSSTPRCVSCASPVPCSVGAGRSLQLAWNPNPNGCDTEPPPEFLILILTLTLTLPA